MKRSTKNLIIAGLGSALLLAGTAQVRATPVIAQIYGVYDAEDGVGNLPSGVLSNPGNPITYSSYSEYDTPSLFFVNPSSYSITGAQIVMTVSPAVNNGWNTLNNGDTQTVSLGTIGAYGITQIPWGGSGPLMNYDYDDSYSGNYGANPFFGNTPGTQNPGSFAADCTLNAPGVHPEWTQYCAPVGNFLVAFTGTLSGSGPDSGDLVSALFGEYDVNGVYTGWEGVDPNGWSENLLDDVHSGTVSGVLANICIGGVGVNCSSPLQGNVPEPGTVWLLAGALMAYLFNKSRRV